MMGYLAGYRPPPVEDGPVERNPNLEYAIISRYSMSVMNPNAPFDFSTVGNMA